MRAPCLIRHVDLGAGVPALAAEPGAGSVLLTFWWGALPLGSHALAAGELPLPPAAVASLALRAIAPAIGAGILERGFRPLLPMPGRQLAAERPPDARVLAAVADPLAEFVRRRNGQVPAPGSTSLVVCTRDRPTDLARCLESLAMTSPRFDQTMVVDNNPANPATREVVGRFPGVEYVAEPRPGLSVARNAGLAAATGEIVAFTDDDVVVHREWPARIARAFAEDGAMAVTGLVLPAALATEAQTSFEGELGGFGKGFRPITYDREFFERTVARGVPVWELGAGANMAFRRRVFDEVGLFDERLGAGASGCSEDSEMWYRLLAAGHVCRYDPSAVVFHRHRETRDALRRQLYAYYRGHVVALFVQYRRHGHRGNLRRAFLTLPHYFCTLVGWGLLLGFGPRHRLLPAEISGWLAGLAESLRMLVTGRLAR